MGGEQTKTVIGLLDPHASEHTYLDVTLVCCIVCVVISAFDPRHFEWNTLYGQSWVVQLAWLVSGVCFSLARSTREYLAQILCYSVMGLIINIAVWLINNWVVGYDFWFVINQMNYIHCLFWICLLLGPLKQHLSHMKPLEGDSVTESHKQQGHNRGEGFTPEALTPAEGSGPHRWRNTALVLFLCVAFADCTFTLAINPALRVLCEWLHESGVTLGLRDMRSAASAGVLGAAVGRSVQAISAGLLIVLVLPRFTNNYQDVTWYLLANFYGHRLFYGYDAHSAADFPFSGFYLVMVATSASYLGLSCKKEIGKLVHRYWMVVVFLLCFCSTPGLHGSLRLQPPSDFYDRERNTLLEAICVVSWLTGAQHMVDPAIMEEDNLRWVYRWAMLVFLMYQGAHWLFPWPISWLVLLGMGPLCWYGWGSLGARYAGEA